MAIKKYENSAEMWNMLKKLRARLWEKYSQEEFAKLLEVSRSTLTNMEWGKWMLKESILKKYSEIFELPMSYFVDIEESVLGIDYEDPHYVFKKVLLYILNRVGDKPSFWKKVFFKLLYFTEFNYFEKYRKSLLGIEFKKLPMWPVPDPHQTDRIFQKMSDDKQLSLIFTKYKWFEQQRFISWLKDIDEVDLITDSKIWKEGFQVVDDVIEKLSHMSGNEISEYSHGDMPYKATKNIWEVIEKWLVFYRSPAYEYVKEEENDF